MMRVFHMQIDLALDIKAELGEGPIWDARLGRLLFCDLMRGEIYTFDPRTAAMPSSKWVNPLARSRPPRAATGWPRPVTDSSGSTRTTGDTVLLAVVEADRPDNRMNDGYCDPQAASGRMMSMASEREAGALYRLDPNGQVTQLIAGVTTSNGIDWSPDGSLVDTWTREPVVSTSSISTPSMAGCSIAVRWS